MLRLRSLLVPAISLLALVFHFFGEPDAASSGDNGSILEPNG
jgi:hypothetical protein